MVKFKPLKICLFQKHARSSALSIKLFTMYVCINFESLLLHVNVVGKRIYHLYDKLQIVADSSVPLRPGNDTVYYSQKTRGSVAYYTPTKK